MLKADSLSYLNITKSLRLRAKLIGWHCAIASLDDKADLPDGLAIIKPCIFEVIPQYGPVPPAWIYQEDSILHNTTEYDKMVVAEKVNWDHKRRFFDEVSEAQLAVADTPITVAIYVALQVEQRKALADLH